MQVMAREMCCKSFVAFFWIIHLSEGIQWLALSKFSAVGGGPGGSPMETLSPEQMCNSMKGSLIKKQVNFCKENPSFMDSVKIGAARAIDECQFQFRSRRWNCSTLDETMNKNMALITASLNSFTSGPSKGLDLHHLPTSSHGGYMSNGLNPLQFDTNNNIYNNIYGIGAQMPNGNSNDRSSRQVQQSLNRKRNVRRGRRLSRRARHGLNGTNGNNNNVQQQDNAEEELNNNDTRMVAANAGQVQQASPAVPAIAPASGILQPAVGSGSSAWSSSKNVSILSPGIPLDDSIMGNDKKKRKNKKNRRKGKKDKEGKVPLGPYPIVSPGTRESAFVHAISSAGVAHALTRACSSGDLENCGCDRSLRGMSPDGFQWSGCSDNVDFGITLSRRFVDARDRQKSKKNPRNAQPLMNLHNNEAGRKLLERNMKVECKCHGVSGSCELKTCWRSVASFRMIGEILKKKFDQAQEVRQRKRRGRRMLEPRFQRFKPHTDTDLVFLKNSPSYCDFNVNEGSLGTHGRECNPNGDGPESCDAMCCNRGHVTRTERRVERCKCKFHWCCFVQCEECYREVEVSTCK